MNSSSSSFSWILQTHSIRRVKLIFITKKSWGFFPHSVHKQITKPAKLLNPRDAVFLLRRTSSLVMKSFGDWHRFLQEITPEKALLCIDGVRSQSQRSFFIAFSPSRCVQHRYGKHMLRVTRRQNRAGTTNQIPLPCVYEHEFSLDYSTAHRNPQLSLWMCRSCLMHVKRDIYYERTQGEKVLILSLFIKTEISWELW